MIWATNKYWFGSNTSKQRNIQAESPLQSWWPLHCKASFSNQRKVFRGGTWVPGTRGHKGCSGSSCLLTGQEERADLSQEARGQYLHPSHCWGLGLLAETLPRWGWGSRGGPSPLYGPPWLLVSQLLFYCVLWFPNRTEELSICFVWKPAYFFYSLVSSFLWGSVLFLLFAFMSFF